MVRVAQARQPSVCRVHLRLVAHISCLVVVVRYASGYCTQMWPRHGAAPQPGARTCTRKAWNVAVNNFKLLLQVLTTKRSDTNRHLQAARPQARALQRATRTLPREAEAPATPVIHGMTRPMGLWMEKRTMILSSGFRSC